VRPIRDNKATISTFSRIDSWEAGIPVTIRGRLAVGLDARGAAMGSLALGAFAFVVWKAVPTYKPAVVLGVAFTIWLALAVGIWRVRKLHVYFSRRMRS
jgi:hypothetical protein